MTLLLQIFHYHVAEHSPNLCLVWPVSWPCNSHLQLVGFPGLQQSGLARQPQLTAAQEPPSPAGTCVCCTSPIPLFLLAHGSAFPPGIWPFHAVLESSASFSTSKCMLLKSSNLVIPWLTMVVKNKCLLQTIMQLQTKTCSAKLKHQLVGTVEYTQI